MMAFTDEYSGPFEFPVDRWKYGTSEKVDKFMIKQKPFGFLFCLSLIVLLKGNVFTIPLQLFDLGKQFNFNDFLINGVLCFMLFSGTSKIKFNDFNKDKYLIGRMAILGTVFSIIVYGLLFWGLGYLSQIPISILQAFILGSIIAPSDPISAMSILSKVGLPNIFR